MHRSLGADQGGRRIGLGIPGDLRDEKFCQELVARTREGLSGLDIIVNNAARQQSRESLLEVSSEDFDATMKTNIYAPFWIIKAALPYLKPGAVIIGTSSEQAYDPSTELYDYAQTKTGSVCMDVPAPRHQQINLYPIAFVAPVSPPIAAAASSVTIGPVHTIKAAPEKATLSKACTAEIKRKAEIALNAAAIASIRHSRISTGSLHAELLPICYVIPRRPII